MQRSWATGYLLAYPIGLIGATHLVFALLALLIFHDETVLQFLWPALCELAVALALFRASRGFDLSGLSFRSALLYAVLTWVLVGLLGAVPIAAVTGISAVDAVFESVSAFTTTGATVLSGLDFLPRSFLLYRQFLQWLGGLGVVIFVVAVLPMLNAGGLRLLRAETPGPIKDDKLAPRVAASSHYLWLVYLLLTLTCIGCYQLAGMSAYDAIAHSLSTVSTGGLSPYDASLGHFDNGAVLWVANVFMLLGAISFALHFRVLSRRRFTMYWSDEETRVYLKTALLTAVVVSLILMSGPMAGEPGQAWQLGVFHAVSFITSTGFVAGDYTGWGDAIMLLLFGAGCVGGCAGSTTGGSKMVRSILTWRVIRSELSNLIHARSLFIVKYQGKPVEEQVLSATMAFMALMALSTLGVSFALTLTGLDFRTAVTAAGACLNVLGPAFGDFGANFSSASDSATVILTAAMILGRLEYFTVLALLFPSFWRY